MTRLSLCFYFCVQLIIFTRGARIFKTYTPDEYYYLSSKIPKRSSSTDNERKYGPPRRHIFKKEPLRCKYGRFIYPQTKGDENHRPIRHKNASSALLNRVLPGPEGARSRWLSSARSQLDRRRACEETARRASEASPLTAIFERARTNVRAFFAL